MASLPNFERFKFDFLAPPNDLAAVSSTVIREWQGQQIKPPSRTGPQVLIRNDGKLAEPAIQFLLKDRDNRPVTIKE